jgi:hypothetical protein
MHNAISGQEVGGGVQRKQKPLLSPSNPTCDAAENKGCGTRHLDCRVRITVKGFRKCAGRTCRASRAVQEYAQEYDGASPWRKTSPEAKSDWKSCGSTTCECSRAHAPEDGAECNWHTVAGQGVMWMAGGADAAKSCEGGKEGEEKEEGGGGGEGGG